MRRKSFDRDCCRCRCVSAPGRAADDTVSAAGAQGRAQDAPKAPGADHRR